MACTAAQFRIWIEFLRYVDLVADSEKEISQVCEFLGFKMVEAMVDTAARMAGRDRVLTPSYQQVSKPIHQHAVERRRRNVDYFEPELSLMRPHAERFGYTV